MHIRHVATEEVETRLRKTVTAHENTVAEANAKAREAEAKALALAEQHALAMETNLKTNAKLWRKPRRMQSTPRKQEPSRKIRKLTSKVNDLQRALDKKTAEELGEGAEIDVFEALKAEFPDDKIRRIPKGTPGADILHVVMLRGKECGTIIYDSKNHNQFRYEHVTKLRSRPIGREGRACDSFYAQIPARNTTASPARRRAACQSGPGRIIATMIRQHLLQLHTLRVSDIERESKTAALYEFITSERCLLLLGRIDERAEDLLEQQTKEMRWHENNWKKQGEAIRGIQKAKGGS